MRPIGHPVAAIERPLGPQPKPHPDTAQNIPEYGETQQTCDRPPRGRDREAFRPSTQAAPRHRSKHTRVRGDATDLRDILENKARQTRSIYGSHGRPASRDASHHAGHNKYGPAEYNRPSSSELRRDIAQYRCAAHPLCFTDEVMDHQIPEGFKPINIESYDGTTDPAVWIEDYHMINTARPNTIDKAHPNYIAI